MGEHEGGTLPEKADPVRPPGLRAVESVTAGLQRPVVFYL